LADPKDYASPHEYVEKHLAPVATELHRIINEAFAPGSTSVEEWASDMVTEKHWAWAPFDIPLRTHPKSVIFDGAAYFTLPKEHLKAKRVKVQLTAVVYAQGGSASFRLVTDTGMIIDGSEFSTSESLPTTITRVLPVADKPGCIVPALLPYHLQGRRDDWDALPVCRRFSLSFIYI
jgi:hypothetical protein